jgi:hypothetical protein
MAVSASGRARRLRFRSNPNPHSTFRKAIKTNRHPSESWKRFSTAEWLVIHLDLALRFASHEQPKVKVKMDPSFRWDDVDNF